MKQLSLHRPNEKLFDSISSYEQLYESWRLVRANKGAAGVDGVEIIDFEERLKEELEELSKSLRDWSYEVRAVRRVEIPKPGSKAKRNLGIPTVRDRIVQQSIRLSLEPLYEPSFSEHSYGFRPGRGQQDAVAAAKRHVTKGASWVVDIDLEKFFDRINHDRLIFSLSKRVTDKRVLRLIGSILRSGVVHNGTYEATKEGCPQGSPLSPLLSNIVLDELDRELERRGLSFCRYADDAKIYVRSERAGKRVMSSITRFIENKLKLIVNQEKSSVARTWKVNFLGFTVDRKGIRISKKALKATRAKLRVLIPRRTHLPLEAQMERLMTWYTGWVAYYQLGNYPVQLRDLEAHMRRRFRAQFIRNTKRRRFLVRKLCRSGVPLASAWVSVYREKQGVWKLSISSAAHRAWGNSWFEGQGFLELSQQKLPHWRRLHVRVW